MSTSTRRSSLEEIRKIRRVRKVTRGALAFTASALVSAWLVAFAWLGAATILLALLGIALRVKSSWTDRDRDLQVTDVPTVLRAGGTIGLLMAVFTGSIWAITTQTGLQSDVVWLRAALLFGAIGTPLVFPNYDYVLIWKISRHIYWKKIQWAPYLFVSIWRFVSLSIGFPALVLAAFAGLLATVPVLRASMPDEPRFRAHIKQYLGWLVPADAHALPAAPLVARAQPKFLPFAPEHKVAEENVRVVPYRGENADQAYETATKDRADPEFEGQRAGDLKVMRIYHDTLEVRFRWCPPGSFRMGSPSNEKGRSPDENQVDVTLTNGFWMMETEVTQGLWRAVMGAGLDWSEARGPHVPVFQVDRTEAAAFGRELTVSILRSWQWPSGCCVVLPTEAQWEYAARAGTTGRFPFGDDESILGEYAWWYGNSGGMPHDVATRKANAWGLNDMLGNVYEWCSDSYDGILPGGVDPRGPSMAPMRVYRGGCWYYDPWNCRPACRNRDTPDFRSSKLGFRVAVVQQ